MSVYRAGFRFAEGKCGTPGFLYHRITIRRKKENGNPRVSASSLPSLPPPPPNPSLSRNSSQTIGFLGHGQDEKGRRQRTSSFVSPRHSLYQFPLVTLSITGRFPYTIPPDIAIPIPISFRSNTYLPTNVRTVPHAPPVPTAGQDAFAAPVAHGPARVAAPDAAAPHGLLPPPVVSPPRGVVYPPVRLPCAGRAARAAGQCPLVARGAVTGTAWSTTDNSGRGERCVKCVQLEVFIWVCLSETADGGLDQCARTPGTTGRKLSLPPRNDKPSNIQRPKPSRHLSP